MNQFTVDLPTKPYVDHFIKLNFGVPADFSCDQSLKQEFRKCLTKPNTRYDYKFIDKTASLYKNTTQILISSDDFYRHGWMLTPTDISSFGKLIERRCKFMMRNLVTVFSIIMQEREAILKFQDEYGFTEDIWSYESIRKDFYRFKPIDKVNLGDEISSKTQKIVMENLSRLGTISHKLHLCHGNNK